MVDDAGRGGGPGRRDAGSDRLGGRPRRRRPEASPAQRALGLLVRREHSRKELARKLVARGIPGDEAEAAVRRMTAEGWQDDGRFAASLARMRMATGYGPIRIRVELGTHGLAEVLIEEALAALEEAGDGDWPALAHAIVRRRYGEGVTADPGLQRKAADFLLRRGFDGDSVRHATRARRNGE